MTAVFTLGSLLGVAVLVVIATVVILGIIICLCACHRKQKAKDSGKSVFYTVQLCVVGMVSWSLILIAVQCEVHQPFDEWGLLH